MQEIKASNQWNKDDAPLLVLAIQGGTLKKGKYECIYAVFPLTPIKIKFLKKLVKLSHAIGTEGECGQPADIEVRDWALIWDQEPLMKIAATYLHVQGNTVWAEGYDRKGKRLGQTISIEIQEFKFLNDAKVIWHSSDESNSVIKSKFGQTFAKCSSKRLKRVGIALPKALKVESSSEMRSVLLQLED